MTKTTLKLILLIALLMPLTVSHVVKTSDTTHWKAVYAIADRFKRQPQEVSTTLEAVSAASEHHGLPKPLIMAIIATESSFNPDVGSRDGGVGLMQITRQSGVMPLYEPTGIEQNVYAGSQLLAGYIQRYGVRSGIESYNAGPRKPSKKYLAKVQKEVDWFASLD